jgi:hypothetical protein
MNRPIGKRPESDRSDWTEQDLLTLDEALPRLTEAIEEIEAELRAAGNSGTRQQLQARLTAMQAARERLSRPSRQPDA